MAQSTRFGRKLALPSTRQIIHEFRVFAAKDEAERLQAAEKTASGGEKAEASSTPRL